MKLVCMGDLVCYIGRVFLCKTGLGRWQGAELKCPSCGKIYFTTATHLLTYDEKSKWPIKKCIPSN